MFDQIDLTLLRIRNETLGLQSILECFFDIGMM